MAPRRAKGPGQGTVVNMESQYEDSRRRLEWFGHIKRRYETENIRAIVEMKMEGKRPRGRPKLRCKDTVRRDQKALNIREEWATDTPHRETVAKAEKI